MPSILVVEDEPELRKLLEIILRREGFEVQALASGEAAWEAILEQAPDVLVTDIGMPGLDGLELCRRVRAHPPLAALPVLLLTARDASTDKHAGFREGADDYLTKPFDPVELVLRIQVHLRRAQQGAGRPEQEVLRVGPLTLDRRTFQVTVGDQPHALTKSEFALVAHLMTHADSVVSAEQLLVEALAYPANVGNTEIVRTHIRNIRQKLEPDPAHPVHLQTVARHGYIIRRPPEGQESLP
jgi:two-component system alkaline phosphatase synthesis response regulator PhoP